MIFSKSDSKKDPKILGEISKAKKLNAGQCNNNIFALVALIYDMPDVF